MHINIATPRELCDRMRTIGQSQFSILTARPWNRFDPDESLWWLIPTTEWPAYRFAKLYFDWYDGEHHGLLCGLHVEKGLGASVRSVYPTKSGAKYILDSGWAWAPFLSALSSEAFTDDMAAASSGKMPELEIRIDGGYVPDPSSFDPYAPAFQKNKASYKFLLRGITGQCGLVERVDSMGLMAPLSTVRTLAGIVAATAEVEKSEWLWIDLWLGVPLMFVNHREIGPIINDIHLWTEHLRPLAIWLQDG